MLIVAHNSQYSKLARVALRVCRTFVFITQIYHQMLLLSGVSPQHTRRRALRVCIARQFSLFAIITGSIIALLHLSRNHDARFDA